MSHKNRAFPIPPAPVVGGALSGFVVGVLLTLLLTGALVPTHRATANPQATLPPPTAGVGSRQLYLQVRRIVVAKLGPALPDQHVTRLRSLQLLPVQDAPGRFKHTQYRSVAIVFRLYNHPLGPVWRVRAAKADVFAVMKALYTSGLPVYNVDLQGQFPVKVGKVIRVAPVLRADMPYRVASRLPWKHWGRDVESRLWALLPQKWIDPRFGK